SSSLRVETGSESRRGRDSTQRTVCAGRSCLPARRHAARSRASSPGRRLGQASLPPPQERVEASRDRRRQGEEHAASFLCGGRQPPPFGCPSNEGCQTAAGRQNERVSARSSHQLHRRWKTVLCWSARQGERRPAEVVERKGVGDQPLAQGKVANARRWRDTLQGRREQ